MYTGTQRKHLQKENDSERIRTVTVHGNRYLKNILPDVRGKVQGLTEKKMCVRHKPTIRSCDAS